MVRNISKMPALFRRSENGNYYFRRTVGTRRITINTGTANHVDAEKFLQNYLSCENASTVMTKHYPVRGIKPVKRAVLSKKTPLSIEAFQKSFIKWQFEMKHLVASLWQHLHFSS